jgi:hypothetical protein
LTASRDDELAVDEPLLRVDANDTYRPDTAANVIAGIPPAWRNHRQPTADDTPATAAASSLDDPPSVASQKRTRSSRRAVEGRPGDPMWPRIARICCCRLPTPIAERLQPRGVATTVESAQCMILDL